MVDYYDDDWGGCEPNHPTSVVMDCSPDPVLSHDGVTSQACRRCRCNRMSHHVAGCAAGKGPDLVEIARERVARTDAARRGPGGGADPVSGRAHGASSARGGGRMSETTGIAVTVSLTDGSTVEVDGVIDVDWSESPFLALRTERGVSLFQMGEVRSVTSRPPDPEDSAVIPVESLAWQPGRWCVVDDEGEVTGRYDIERETREMASSIDTVAREETVTLTRLVPVE